MARNFPSAGELFSSSRWINSARCSYLQRSKISYTYSSTTTNVDRNTCSTHGNVEATFRKSRESIYWPGMTTQIADYISRCETCQQLNIKQQKKKTLKQRETQDRPWAKIETDIFTLHGRDYLITVDNVRGFWEIDYLGDLMTWKQAQWLESSKDSLPDTAFQSV